MRIQGLTAAQREQIREAARDQVRDAQRQVRDAQKQIEAATKATAGVGQTTVRVELPQFPQDAVPPTPAIAPMPPMEGQTILLPGQSVSDIPPRAEEMATIFFVVIAFIIIGLPIARAIGRWIDRKSSAPAIRTADVEPHLLRIEQAVEAMAIEIERISESQRYLTKLQAGPRDDAVLVPRRHEG